MDLGMLVIVAVIVIPGYFIVSYFTKALYSQSNMMDESTDPPNNNQLSENTIGENAGESNDNADLPQNYVYKRAGVKFNENNDGPVIMKYRKPLKGKK